MADNPDAKHLKRCFQEMIHAIEQTIDTLRTKGSDPQQDILYANTLLSTGILTFTLNKDEDGKIMNLRLTLEHIIENHRVYLSTPGKNYLSEFLLQYHYHIHEARFTNSFTMNSLYSFQHALKGADASIDAFPAAWQGQLPPVRDFVKTYPLLKDKPGLHGTTLLFSAARNNHLQVVRYLVENAKCFVNAQNLQHLEKALKGSTAKGLVGDYSPIPSAGSTPLHGACYNGHLEVVKYLIEHDADYFIRNQAHETPIGNGKRHDKIRQFFEEFLILGYSQTEKVLPEEPITEKPTDKPFDCIWEYKSLTNDDWYSFSLAESNELNRSLIVPSDEDMKREVYLHIRTETYSVSTTRFLRSGKAQDPKKNLAWVRCRGSSIWNFDCLAVWQLMIRKHPSINPNEVPSLEVFDVPRNYDSRFKLQLNCWYNCTPQISVQLDRSINYRRKKVRMDVDFITTDILELDLQQFTFTNAKKTIEGFIRWIPKLVSRKQQDSNRLTVVDNFQNLANVDPIPYTTKQHKSIYATPYEDETPNNADPDQPAAEIPLNMDDVDEDDVINKVETTKPTEEGFYSVVDIEPEDYTVTVKKESAKRESIDDVTNKTTNSRAFAAPAIVESPSSTLRQEIESIKNALDKKEQHNQLLQQKLSAVREEMELQLNDSNKKSAKHEQEIAKLLKKQEELNTEKNRIEGEIDSIRKAEKAVKTIDYKGVETELIQSVLTPKFSVIIDYLKTTKTKFSKYVNDKIPQMLFNKMTNQYIVTLIGFPEHHDAFREMLKRTRNVLSFKQEAINSYRTKLDNLLNRIKQDLSSVGNKTQYWKQYEKLFIQYINEKGDEYANKFKGFSDKKMTSLFERSISEDITSILNEVNKQTDDFIKHHNLLQRDIESLKLKALEEFIQRNIKNQRNHLEKKPSSKSITILEKFIDKVRNTLKTDPRCIGHETKHYNMIPKLLQRLMLYYCCFKIQLPLFESSDELLDKIEKNTVITIATSTGSGKSTLLPALLAAEGYDKITVTQPRRLPCTLISQRVNETMTVVKDPSSPKLAGWAVSGAETNPSAKVLYLTDGLLKERLLYDQNFITKDTKVNRAIVFFIDEVHERSVNIDHCLALLARMLKLYPNLKSKVKIIISSATLDASVPGLFRQIPSTPFSEFEMPNMGTLYPVTTVARPNENVLDLVQELYKEHQRHDQILCFVSSVKDVTEYIDLLKKITGGAIIGYPLIQSQQATVQQEYLEIGTVFFSTTVAETSLTFPHLKYVIDTGMINIPVYDPDLKRTVLKTIRAAESTIKQRRGRLGRTQPGTYYALYNFKVDAKRFPTPQICQSELINIEFSLRKSPLEKGLDYMKEFLPDKPSQRIIDQAVQELRNLGIVEKAPGELLTNHGRALAKLPDFGSLAMSKSVLAALKEYGCGRDLIVLSSILSVLNTSSILKAIPNDFKSTDGDFMTLLNVMNEVLHIKQSVAYSKFQLQRVCQEKNLTNIRHFLQQALRRQTNLERAFNSSPDYRTQAQIKSNSWELIAKSLLVGYHTNVFASMKELKERNDLYIRYNETGENDIASLDSKSVLYAISKKNPPALVLVHSIRYATSVRSKAILSFVGEIKANWIEYKAKRELKLSSEEEQYLTSGNIVADGVAKFSHRIDITMSNTPKAVILVGPAGTVFDGELYLRQNMEDEFKFTLDTTASLSPTQRTNLTNNLKSVMKMPYIFNPMKWRWENQKQVTITINNSTSTGTCEITVKGRHSEYQNVKKEFDSFLSWLQDCAVIRHPNSGVPPRAFRPQVRSKYRDIEERIAHITDPERTDVDFYNGTKGKDATRETRMEVVAWIAVCKFSCKIEGGFVRDWVVRKEAFKPPNLVGNPKAWISNNNGQLHLDEKIVPADIDCHLPTHAYFDIQKFQDELYKYDITCKVTRDDWRYILLLDEEAPTGPFMMDLIEPHVTLTHDRIDFDVNNLSLEKEYTRELGMRVDIQVRPYSIELETIVDNIKNKRFQVLRPTDSNLDKRIHKMVHSRGWHQIGEPFSVIPSPHPKYPAVLVPLPSSSALYKDLEKQIKTIGSSVKIISIEQVKNPLLEDTYESMKKLIARQCPGSNPNERLLFHGTKEEGIDGIRDNGFDDRYYNSSGNWGHGAYFADDPVKSNNYTDPAPNEKTRVIYYCKVTLGIESKKTKTDNKLKSAPIGYHSVVGTLSGFTEYIVYRYGQALPYIKIIYKA